jgi:hypothetical protein
MKELIMRRNVLVLLVAVLLAVPALAADGYTFNIRVTDGRSGLLSNPDFEKLGMTSEQLARAAADRVVVLDSADGTRWHWLMLSWFAGDPTVEQFIAERGVVQEEADIAILAGKTGHFRLRCLRDECAVTLARPNERESAFTAKRGELSPNLPLPSRVTLTFR